MLKLSASVSPKDTWGREGLGVKKAVAIHKTT